MSRKLKSFILIPLPLLLMSCGLKLASDQKDVGGLVNQRNEAEVQTRVNTPSTAETGKTETELHGNNNTINNTNIAVAGGGAVFVIAALLLAAVAYRKQLLACVRGIEEYSVSQGEMTGKSTLKNLVQANAKELGVESNLHRFVKKKTKTVPLPKKLDR